MLYYSGQRSAALTVYAQTLLTTDLRIQTYDDCTVLLQEEIGVAVVMDVDGKLATLDGADLTGYAVSKPIKFGGQVQRTEAVIAVQVYSSTTQFASTDSTLFHQQAHMIA
jgi:hypothetical protein